MRGLLLLPLLALIGCAGPDLVNRVIRPDGSLAAGSLEYGRPYTDADALHKARVLCQAGHKMVGVNYLNAVYDSYIETDIEGKSKDVLVLSRHLDFDCPPNP